MSNIFTQSYVINVEELHAGAAVEIVYHSYGVRKDEKKFNGIILESNPLSIKIDYYDPKEMHIKKRHLLIRRIFTLEDMKNQKISLRVLH